MSITRDAFLYLDSDNPRFAQCGTCSFGKDGKCGVMNGEPVSAKDGSCGFYVPGSPISRIVGKLTKKQTGYVERQVRCENCIYFDEGNCGLYEELNKKFLEFDLDSKVKEYGCCNAQTPGDKDDTSK